MNKTKIFGDYEITILREGGFDAPSTMLLRQGGGDTGLAAGEMFKIDVNAFLVGSAAGVTLVDACIGPAWGEGFGQARTALAAAGVAPADITRVLLTHLHVDHALGLLEGDAAWLPNAEIVVPQADLVYFTDSAERDSLPAEKQEAFHLTARLLAAYAGRLHAIPPGAVPGLAGVALVALPGHTPGHGGYLFQGDETLLIWADTVHFRERQLPDPAIGLIFDVDPARAYETRKDTLALVAREGWVVAGSHVTGFGRVEREGEAYRWVEVA